MGLDQYLEIETLQKLHYWRKHPNLHGLMEEIYREKGGEGIFNCKRVYLDQDDCDRIINAIKTKSLPETSGFFFGESDPDDQEQNKEDIEVFKNVKKLIKDGKTVFYDSWW